MGVENTNQFNSAIHAVITGDTEKLAGMLEDDPGLAKARSSSEYHATLLHYVAANGVEIELQKTPPNAVEIAEILFEAGADPDATADIYGGGSGSTPLVGLVSSEHPDKAGVQKELVKVFCKRGAKVNGIDDDGMPMATALAFMYPPAVSGLVECGARLDNIIYAAASGNLELVKSFINDDGSLNSLPDEGKIGWFAIAGDPNGVLEQAFVYACMCGHQDIAGFLLGLGVDINAHPKRNETALHLAGYRGQSEIVKFLLENGAEINIRDERWNSTPLSWIATGNHPELLKFVLEHREPDIFDAVELGLINKVIEILDRDPELVNAPNGGGWPLRIAAYEGHTNIVKLLLQRGADPTQANDEGKTALIYAEERGHSEITDLIKNHLKDSN